MGIKRDIPIDALDRPAACIFCGEKHPARDLTREHIIPAGLGGNDWLENATCPKCQINTSQLELEVLRGHLQYVRALFGSPYNKHKGKKPASHASATVTVGGSKFEVDIKLKSLPAVGGLLSGLPEPMFMHGRYETAAPASMTVTHIASIQTVMSPQHGFDEITFQAPPWEPLKFCRFVAKIAHTFACAELGRSAFDHVLGGFVLGEDPHYWNYVGNSSKPDLTRSPHSIKLWVSKALLVDAIIIDVRLFPSTYLPVYRVVAGPPALGLELPRV